MGQCQWWCTDSMLQAYHDLLWGVPVHDDRMHFEALCLEAMQSGLNWQLILKKKDILRQCFSQFDYEAVSQFSDRDIHRILCTPGMIHSRRKIEAIIRNAGAFIRIIHSYGSFDRYIWSFTQNRTAIYPSHWNGHSVASNALSDQICTSLKEAGFRYLGSVTVYSYLQAVGIINDHEPSCPRYKELLNSGSSFCAENE